MEARAVHAMKAHKQEEVIIPPGAQPTHLRGGPTIQVSLLYLRFLPTSCLHGISHGQK